MPEITINTNTGEVVEDRQQRADHLHAQACIKREAAWEFYASLAEIQRDELWRELGYGSFTEYVQAAHDIKYNYAKKMIEAASVRGNLYNCTGQLPATESQARPLTKLPADEQADAWEEVVTDSEESGEKITAKKVEQVVAKRRNKIKPDPSVALAEAELLKSDTLTMILDLNSPKDSAGWIVEYCDNEYVRELVRHIEGHLLKGDNNG